MRHHDLQRDCGLCKDLHAETWLACLDAGRSGTNTSARISPICPHTPNHPDPNFLLPETPTQPRKPLYAPLHPLTSPITPPHTPCCLVPAPNCSPFPPPPLPPAHPTSFQTRSSHRDWERGVGFLSPEPPNPKSRKP